MKDLLTVEQANYVYKIMEGSFLGTIRIDAIQKLKDAGVIKRSAIEEARKHWEYFENLMNKEYRRCFLTEVRILKDLYEKAVKKEMSDKLELNNEIIELQEKLKEKI